MRTEKTTNIRDPSWLKGASLQVSTSASKNSNQVAPKQGQLSPKERLLQSFLGSPHNIGVIHTKDEAALKQLEFTKEEGRIIIKGHPTPLESPFESTKALLKSAKTFSEAKKDFSNPYDSNQESLTHSSGSSHEMQEWKDLQKMWEGQKSGSPSNDQSKREKLRGAEIATSDNSKSPTLHPLEQESDQHKYPTPQAQRPKSSQYQTPILRPQWQDFTQYKTPQMQVSKQKSVESSRQNLYRSSSMEGELREWQEMADMWKRN